MKKSEKTCLPFFWYLLKWTIKQLCLRFLKHFFTKTKEYELKCDMYHVFVFIYRNNCKSVFTIFVWLLVTIYKKTSEKQYLPCCRFCWQKQCKTLVILVSIKKKTIERQCYYFSHLLTKTFETPALHCIRVYEQKKTTENHVFVFIDKND